VIALGGPAQVLEPLQIEGPVFTVDENVVKVELPQNVDHPWTGESKAVAIRLAAGAHGSLDPVRLLHWTSSCVLARRKNGALASPRHAGPSPVYSMQRSGCDCVPLLATWTGWASHPRLKAASSGRIEVGPTDRINSVRSGDRAPGVSRAKAKRY
jgi:hypothetical protein